MTRTSDEVNNILAKAVERPLKFDEALVLADVKGVELAHLLYTALLVKEKYFKKLITFSRKVFIPLTNICRNKCKYCGFSKELDDKDSIFMSFKEAMNIVKVGEKYNVKEVLICTGEKPELKYKVVKDRLRKYGYETFTDYVKDFSEKVLKETDKILVHANIGVLSKEEMLLLKPYVASIGLMLECSSERLCLPNMPHEESPSKYPKIRLKMIKEAGILKIPFTTGILVGIGETMIERIESLFKIRELHERYDHIQEVIIQNFQPQQNTPMSYNKPPTVFEMIKTIAIARLIFHGRTSVQAPPNLEKSYQIYLMTGINDWGGISPVTIDYINPQNPWPRIYEIREKTEEFGYILRERLPVYPRYIKSKDFIHENIRSRVEMLIDDDGLVKKEFECLE